MCEIKFRHKIDKAVVNEMDDKIKKLKIGRSTTVRPVLIYQGGISDALVDEGYFHYLLLFETLLASEEEL